MRSGTSDSKASDTITYIALESLNHDDEDNNENIMSMTFSIMTTTITMPSMIMTPAVLPFSLSSHKI